MDPASPVTAFLEQTVDLLRRLDGAAILRARDLILRAYREGRRVFTMGNGGSASTASHFACDLAKTIVPPGGPAFDVRCLTDNAGLFTAWANDAPREQVFVNQMRGLLRAGDGVIAISVHGGSGFSSDLVQAVRFANGAGAWTLALVGFDGGPLHRESTCSLLVPVDSTPQTEAIHLVIQHVLVHLLRSELLGEPPARPA